VVTKLNATGTGLAYSTYLGGNSTSRSGGNGIAVDASGDAHVTGWTNATAFPTKNALQTANAGGNPNEFLGNTDAFVTVFNPSGSGLLFSSYFGGTDNGSSTYPGDIDNGIALDAAGNAYVGGQTRTTNFPTTAGAYQRTPGPGFVLEID